MIGREKKERENKNKMHWTGWNEETIQHYSVVFICQQKLAPHFE